MASGSPRKARSSAPRSILVPVDGSPASRHAIVQAAAWARRLGARLLALHVITPFELTLYASSRPALVRPAEFERRATAIAARMLAAAQRTAAAHRVTCRARTIWDTAVAAAILRAAREERCELIVMATHGHTGLQRMLLGSITQKVLAESPLPVLVCRRP